MYDNYKRISFLLGLISLSLIATDSNVEKTLQKSLLSLFNIGMAESSELSATAPTSLLNIFENVRNGLIDNISEGMNFLVNMQASNESPVSTLYWILGLFLTLFKFLVSYIFIFYPLIILIFYFLFTSRLFRSRYDYR
jgi:hypothetical protein